MKNKNKKFRLARLFLTLLLMLFSVSGVNAETAAGECSPIGVAFDEDESLIKARKEACEAIYKCRWSAPHARYNLMTGEIDKMRGQCHTGNEVCLSINERDSLNEEEKKSEFCEEQGCWWNDDTKRCHAPQGLCAGRTRVGCALDSDCRWLNNTCMFRAEKSSLRAVAEIEGICSCPAAGADGDQVIMIPVWFEEGCKADRNDFWEETIPDTCMQPLTNDGVMSFCQNNSAALSPHGRSKCNRGIMFAIKAGEQQCLDDSERRYQDSLKNVDAREQRRNDDALCRAGADEIYPGAVFSGAGLRGGALEAHRKLTKSISHETDLKVLVLGWTKFALELTAVIAVVALIWAGMLYVTDLGDGGNQEKAKKIIMWVVIGILLILGSYAIVNTLMKADLGDTRRAEISTTTYLS